MCGTIYRLNWKPVTSVDVVRNQTLRHSFSIVSIRNERL